MDILAMIRICISTLTAAMLSPANNFVFIVFIFIVYMQYKKIEGFQGIIYGKPKDTLKNLVSTSVLAGILAGTAISIPMVLAGISFSQDMGIQYLIPLSVLLMVLDPRLLCFSYSGGIISIISLIFGFKKVDVSGIMLLVGLLHLLESLLIYFDGYRGAIPVFMENEDGSIRGGFTMQRFWPIPIAIVLFAGYGGFTGDVVSTPEWWPIIRPHLDPSRIGEAVFTAIPISAILGYSEFTSSYLPKEKCKNTSFKLAIYSLILILLSIVSSYIYIFKYIAALFAPIAHEGLIRYERKLEEKRQPIFTPVKNGVKVLDTLPGGPGEKMGIKPGDIILSINNRTIVTIEGMDDFFKEYINYIWVNVKNRFGEIRTLEYKDYYDGIDSLGIISVPKDRSGILVVKEKKAPIERWLRKLKKD